MTAARFSKHQQLQLQSPKALEFPDAQNPIIVSNRGIRIRSRLEPSTNNAKTQRAANVATQRYQNAYTNQKRFEKKFGIKQTVFDEEEVKAEMLKAKRSDDSRKLVSGLGQLDADELSTSKTQNTTIRPIRKVLQKKKNFVGKLANRTNEALIHKALEDLRKDLLSEGLGNLLNKPPFDNSQEQFQRVSEDYKLGHVFKGQQKHYK